MLSICSNCALEYDPNETTSPWRYCSIDCYHQGAKAYNRGPMPNKVKLFAIKLIDKLHYLQHNNDDRFDCGWDDCVEAKILGL